MAIKLFGLDVAIVHSSTLDIALLILGDAKFFFCCYCLKSFMCERVHIYGWNFNEASAPRTYVARTKNEPTRNENDLNFCENLYGQRVGTYVCWRKGFFV